MNRKKITIFSIVLNLTLVSFVGCLSIDKEKTLEGFSGLELDLSSNEYARAEEELRSVTEQLEIENIKTQIESINKKDLTDALSKLKLGILYHEASLLSANNPEYSKISFSILSNSDLRNSIGKEYLPFLFSYLASARSLQGRDTSSLNYLKDAFWILDQLVLKSKDKTGIALFLRGSISENLPWIFGKSSVAKSDFQEIIQSQKKDSFINYINFGWRINNRWNFKL